MEEDVLDSGLSIADMIAFNTIMIELPDNEKREFIEEYSKAELEEWQEYLDFRDEMGYPKLELP